ncbi:MAG: hypothetical protein JO079_13250 [Frankiaceae bacterium]|nr:hypothetical protein [Frankiaceae bacterium]MBV9369729.1 hypothetical protein [Frankiales bacterium]
MKQRLVVTAVTLALAAGTGGFAHAAPAPTTRNCGHLIVDPRGNAYEFFLPTKPYNPEADLLSVDAVTTKSTVVFTVRMASVNAHPTIGAGVVIYFTVARQGGTSDYLVSVNHDVDGTAYGLENQDTNAVTPLTGSTDPATGTYSVSVPRAGIEATYRGALLKDLGVFTSQDLGVSAANGGFIEQSTGPEYRYRVGYGYGCRK